MGFAAVEHRAACAQSDGQGRGLGAEAFEARGVVPLASDQRRRRVRQAALQGGMPDDLPTRERSERQDCFGAASKLATHRFLAKDAISPPNKRAS
jgi:hypothetical protein